MCARSKNNKAVSALCSILSGEIDSDMVNDFGVGH